MKKCIDNTEIAVVRTVEMVAAEINGIKDQTRQMVLVNAIAIGQRLAEAHEMVPYGEWEKWLKENVNYSKTTATNLINIFNAYSTDQGQLFGVQTKSQALGQLSYTQALVLLGLPAEERETFVIDHDMESISTRELQKIVDEKKAAEKKAQEFNSMHIEDLSRIDKLEKDLEKAKTNKDKEKIKQLKDQLKNEQKYIAELQKNAHKKEIVEKVPDEVVAELDSLRKKIKLTDTDAKFKVNYKIFHDSFEEMAKLAQSDVKYAKALTEILSKLQAEAIKLACLAIDREDKSNENN